MVSQKPMRFWNVLEKNPFILSNEFLQSFQSLLVATQTSPFEAAGDQPRINEFPWSTVHSGCAHFTACDKKQQALILV